MPVTAKYWRVYSSTDQGAASSWWCLGYLRFNTDSGWSDTLGFTAISGGNLSGYPVANAFDPLLTESKRWIADTLPGWVGCNFDTPQIVTQVEITAHDVSAHMTQMPGEVLIEYSNDGSTWTTLETYNPAGAWTASQVRTFSVQAGNTATERPALTVIEGVPTLFRTVDYFPLGNIPEPLPSLATVTETVVPKRTATGYADSSLSFDGNNAAAFSDDVDVGGDLGLAGHVTFTNDSVGIATARWQGSDGSGSTVYNVPTGKGHVFTINNVTTGTILAGGLDFFGSISATGPLTSRGAANVHQSTGDLDTTGLAYTSYQDNSTGSYVERGWVGYGVGDGDMDVNNSVGDVHLRVSGTRVLSATSSGTDVVGAGTYTTGVTVATGQDVLANFKKGQTYNPTLTCSTSGTVTLNTSFDTLSYTRIGDIVNVRGYLELSAVSSPLGDLRLSLPIVSANPAELAGRSVAPVTVGGSVSKNCQDFGAFIDEGVSYASIVITDAATLSFAGAAQMQASTSIIVNFCYQV